METGNEAFRDRVATVDAKGERIWVYAKKTRGKLFNYRQFFGYFLVALFLSAPFIRIQGEPLLLFDVLGRKFVLLGQVFYPQDFLIFGLAMLTFFVFIVLFTIAYGRAWCGWACPQTVFMELVFRRIEFWLEGEGPTQKFNAKNGMTAALALRRVVKFVLFFVVSVIIGNYLLIYLVGTDRFFEYLKLGPSANFSSFATISILSAAIFINFTWFREQACTLVCPYGRLQGALLDSNSIVVAYDFKRGEPRAPFKKGEDRIANNKGHCVNCHSCVQVCPTGIDIRNGTQLECVNCTSCIDACNSVMDRFKLPRGLIRYASENEIESGEKNRFTPRMIFYSFVLVGLLGLLTSLIFIRNDVETTILRVPGMLYQKMDENHYSNLYNLHVINNSKHEMPIELKLLSHDGEIKVVGKELNIKELEKYEGVFMIVLDKNQITSHKEQLEIGVFTNGELIEKLKTTFISP